MLLLINSIAEILAEMPSNELPVVALLALSDDVRLGILPNSHNIVSFADCDRVCQAIEFKFKLGEIIVFHPLLVHYGCAYTAAEQSLRAHFYFDNIAISKPKNNERKTFFFQVSVLPVARCPPNMQGGGRKESKRGANLKRKRVEFN